MDIFMLNDGLTFTPTDGSLLTGPCRRASDFHWGGHQAETLSASTLGPVFDLLDPHFETLLTHDRRTTRQSQIARLFRQANRPPDRPKRGRNPRGAKETRPGSQLPASGHV